MFSQTLVATRPKSAIVGTTALLHRRPINALVFVDADSRSSRECRGPGPAHPSVGTFDGEPRVICEGGRTVGLNELVQMAARVLTQAQTQEVLNTAMGVVTDAENAVTTLSDALNIKQVSTRLAASHPVCSHQSDVMRRAITTCCHQKTPHDSLQPITSTRGPDPLPPRFVQNHAVFRQF